MHEQFANSFYGSYAWKQCRKAYMQKAHGLCEKCLKIGLLTPAVHVHHKVWLTPENISDPSITLCWDNLEALCEECHQEVHTQSEKRWTVGKDGTITAR